MFTIHIPVAEDKIVVLENDVGVAEGKIVVALENKVVALENEAVVIENEIEVTGSILEMLETCRNCGEYFNLAENGECRFHNVCVFKLCVLIVEFLNTNLNVESLTSFSGGMFFN